MSDKSVTESGPEAELAELTDDELQSRRGFLIGMGRWSKIVIGAALFGGLAVPQSEAEAGWLNRRYGGGGWINRRGGGWVNRRGGGGWVHRNGGGRGGSWINRR